MMYTLGVSLINQMLTVGLAAKQFKTALTGYFTFAAAKVAVHLIIEVVA